MFRQGMSVEKGTELELMIAELFRQKGYQVTHNILIEGRSGASHQIDVFAEYEAPLHTSKIIIEAKHYESNIDKDIIMKLIHIQQDVSADKAILVTTSNFTSGAYKIAAQYNNVELWDGQKTAAYLQEIKLDEALQVTQPSFENIKIIASTFSHDAAKEHAQNSAEKRSKKGMFGRGKLTEKVSKIAKVYYPYYDVEFDAKIHVIEKTGWMKKEKVERTVSSRTGIDGKTGALIDVTNDGISYEYSYLTNLSVDEASLLFSVSKLKEFVGKSLASVGWSHNKIEQLVSSLVGKRLLIQKNSRPATYAATKTYPYDPSVFISLLERHKPIHHEPDEQKLNFLIPSGNIPTLFEKLWLSCNIKSIDQVYYPYYAILFSRDDSTKRVEVLDGINGSRQPYIEKLIPTLFFG